MIIELLLFILIIGIFIKIIINKPQLSLLLIYLIIMPCLLGIISILYINTGDYISELNTVTYNNGSGIMYQLILLPFLLVFYFCLWLNNSKYKLLFKKISSCKQHAYKLYRYGSIYIFVVIFSLIYLFIDLIVHGIPLFNTGLGLKANYFFMSSHFPFITLVYSFVCLYSPSVLGFLYIIFSSEKYKFQKSILKWIIILTLVYSYMIGFKVSGIISIFFFFFTPITIEKIYFNPLKMNLNVNPKKLFIIVQLVLVMGIFIGSILLNYKYTLNNGENTNLWDYLMKRTLGLSNHLIWSVKNYFDNGYTLSTNEIIKNFSNEISTIFIQPSNTNVNYGVAKLMSYFGDPATVKWYLQNQTRMGGSFITVFYFNCGPFVTSGIGCLLAIFLEKLIRIYVEALSNKSIVEIILSTKILYSYYAFLWNSGSLSDLFTIGNIIVIIVLFIIQKYRTITRGAS